jgi:hypothetical protein
VSCARGQRNATPPHPPSYHPRSRSFTVAPASSYSAPTDLRDAFVSVNHSGINPPPNRHPNPSGGSRRSTVVIRAGAPNNEGLVLSLVELQKRPVPPTLNKATLEVKNPHATGLFLLIFLFLFCVRAYSSLRSSAHRRCISGVPFGRRILKCIGHAARSVLQLKAPTLLPTMHARTHAKTPKRRAGSTSWIKTCQ